MVRLHAGLCQHRAECVVPGRMEQMIRAVRKRDFATFAELTMKDSNQFHATCLDTYPPVFYLNDVSRRIINLVHRYNRHCGETRVSVTGSLLLPHLPLSDSLNRFHFQVVAANLKV